MDVIGKSLLRVDTAEGKAYFNDVYEVSVWQVIVDGELDVFHLTLCDTFKHIAVVGYQGAIDQTFTLDTDDHLIVYSEARCEGLFNTDGMAFIRLVKEDKVDETIAMWCLRNSPYDLSEEDLAVESGKNDAQEMVAKVNAYLAMYQLEQDASLTNTVFVKML